MSLVRKTALWGIGLAVILALAAGIAAVLTTAGSHTPFQETTSAGSTTPDEQEPVEENAIHVRTIRPRRDPSFILKIQEVAYVEPYYQAELLSQVAGTIKYLQKHIGDQVTQGEVLLEIDAPDVVQEVALKEATVEQRKQDKELARKKVEIAQAAVDVANSDRQLKETLVSEAAATRDLRLMRWHRYQGVAQDKAVPGQLVDEMERDYVVAKYRTIAADVAVKKAESEWREAKANLDAANADVNFKQALVEVARKDRDLAEARASYTRITAPFDGVIIQRSVDPGDFVQNATTGSPEPLLTVARTDAVTVFMKVPNNFAPLVTKNIDAVIQMNELPGEEIKGKVTRFSPSVQNKDRTMRVEVDLYNRGEQDYLKFVQKGLATFLTPITAWYPVEAAALTGAARISWGQHKKGTEAFPLFPKVTGESTSRQLYRLLPGMTGYMELRLPCDNSYLLPVSAVFDRGGKSYIAEVRAGTAHLVPVVKQAEDGRLAKVVTIVRRANPKTGVRESVRRELTGNEEIIASGQGEIAEGQAVQATPWDWGRPKASSGDN
jgi:membrane fusion protein (multidrug efflux system)